MRRGWRPIPGVTGTTGGSPHALQPPITLVSLVLAGLLLVTALESAPTGDAPGEMSDAAEAFLASLSADQRARARFSFGDEERLNWHFVPRRRRWLAFRDMNDGQRELACLGPRLHGGGSVWRDFDGDFGRDLLRDHHAAHPHPHHHRAPRASASELLALHIPHALTPLQRVDQPPSPAELAHIARC